MVSYRDTNFSYLYIRFSQKVIYMKYARLNTTKKFDFQPPVKIEKLVVFLPGYA